MKRMKKHLLATLLILTLLLLSACSSPEGTYKSAQSLLAKGKYTEAAEQFTSLGSYEDAATLAMYCKACALCESGDYENGIAGFEALGDYKDCVYRITYYTARSWDEGSVGTTNYDWMERAKELYKENPLYLDSTERIAALDKRIEKAKKQTYDDAVAMAEKGQYDDAIDILWYMGDYEDSWERVRYYRLREQEDALATSTDHDTLLTLATDYSNRGEYLDCAKRAEALTKRANTIIDEKYQAAAVLMKAEKYAEAIAAFTEIKTHRDSATQITACETAILDGKYDAAIALERDGKYEEAISAFKAIESHKDSAEQIKACEIAIFDGKYDAAIALKRDGKYEEAISAFKAIESHKDSAEQIKACEIAILDGKYDAAVALMNMGKYTEAYEAFVALNLYKDSKTQADSILISYPNVKYQNAKVGDIISLGAYEQDSNIDNGTEDIEWLVLAKESNRLLVISRYALDCKPYNTPRTSVTWRNCTLRKWLNTHFFNTAFSSTEQGLIPTVTVSADKNPKYSTSPGDATQDKVFLLSIPEANKYFDSDYTRACKLTVYADDQYPYVLSAGAGRWWLRSPGSSQDCAAYVYHADGVYESGEYVNVDYLVRPALWINLEP